MDKPHFIECRKHGRVTHVIRWGVDAYTNLPRFKCGECSSMKAKKMKSKQKLIESFFKEEMEMSFTAQIHRTNEESDNHDVLFYNDSGEKQVGYAYLSKKEKKVGLVRCPHCKRDNFPTSILRGKCAWCKFDAIAFIATIETNKKEEEKNIIETPQFEKVEKRMNTTKIKPAKPFIGLSTIAPSFEWEEISSARCGRYVKQTQDKITLRKKINELKSGVKTYKLTVMIGAEVMALLGLSKGDKINLFRDKRNTNLFMLRKSDAAGYVIAQASGSPNCHISPTLPDDIKILKEHQSYSVKFDFNGDNSLIFDAGQTETV